MQEEFHPLKNKIEKISRYCPSFTKKIIDKFLNSKYGMRIFSAVFWSMFGAAFQKVLLLISSFVCMNILGKDGYGRLGIVRSTIQIFIIFGAVGLGSTATKYLAEFRNKDKQKLISYYTTIKITSIVSGLIVTAAILLFAKRLAIYLEDVSLTNSIRIGGILLYFSIINSIQTGFLAGIENFKSIAISSILGGTAEFLAIVIGSYFWSVNGALVGYGIGLLIISLINEMFIIKCKALKVRLFTIKWTMIKEIIIFSIPLLGSSLMVSPVMWYVQSLLVKACNFSELAIYNAADQWRMVLLFIPSALSRIILPMLSNVLATGQKKDYINIVMLNVKINFMTTGSMLLLYLCGLPIIIFLYKFKFNVFPVFALLGLSTVFSCLATVIGQAIISRSKTWIGMLFNLGWGIMIILFSKLFISLELKATAIALATLLSYFFHTVFQAIYLKSVINSLKS